MILTPTWGRNDPIVRKPPTRLDLIPYLILELDISNIHFQLQIHLMKGLDGLGPENFCNCICFVLMIFLFLTRPFITMPWGKTPGDHSFNITWNAGYALEADGAQDSKWSTFDSHMSGAIEWDPFWRDQTMQVYANVEGISKGIVHCLG